MKKTTIIAAVLAGCSLAVSAQVADIRDTDARGYITRAEGMLIHGNAAGALDQLNALERMQLPLNAGNDLQQQMLYLRAEALFVCDDASCLDVISQYIEMYGGTQRAQRMRMLRGDYYFFHADYAEADRQYSLVEQKALDPTQAESLTYRRGLSALRTADYDKAAALFTSLLGTKQYADPARFYLAYIDYIHGDYKAARQGFEQYARNYKAPQQTGRSMIPTAPDASYYLAQIDFAEGKYADVIREAPSLLKVVNDPEAQNELNRIMGESLYNTGEADRAEPYLRRYLKSTGTSAHTTAMYMLGSICYDRNEYAEAASFFEPVAAGNDSLGQGASLYLGQCEMKLGEPGAATVAFERAYRLNYDPKVSEAALYNYAAMLSAGSSVPFARSSVELLEQFVQRYPNSEYAANADEYLAGAYFNEKDYRRALQSINRINKPSAAVLQAKQKILYELGVEEISNGQPARAVQYLTQAAAMTDVDRSLAIRSTLWLGDAYYNSGNYPKAVQSYNSFLQKAPSNDPNISLARYDLGYALYRQDKYADALKSFEAVLNRPGTLNKAMIADARTRAADCMYATGSHSAAMDMYQQAMKENANNADYAALQRANMMGLLGQNKQKIEALNRMIADYPHSTLVPSAILEKAQTLLAMGEEKSAIDSYQQLVQQYPHSSEARQGLLQLAIAYSNAGNTAEAVRCYRRIISTWPTSEQAVAANDDLRNIYARIGGLDEYASFLNSIPGAPKLDVNEIDRLTFEAAENALIEDQSNIRLMQEYLNRFPDGAYLDRALYSVARAQYDNGKYAEALGLLKQLQAKRADSPVAPEATLLRATIYEETDLGSTHDALETWRELLQKGGKGYYAQACAGIMRNTDNPEEQVEYANRLTHTTGLSTEQMEEAIFYRALGELGRQQYNEAVADLKQLANNPVSLYGSRASVELAEYFMGQKQWNDAQNLLETFTDSGTPHQYWLARAFIDLADVYHAQGRQTLARQYVQSLKENYPGSESDILKMINDRLAKWR